MRTKHSRKKTSRWATTRSLGLCLFIALLFRALVAEAYVIPSGSMEPGLLVGDRLVATKFSFGLRVPLTDIWVVRWAEPKRGEVVLFSDPRGSGETLVKRVVAGAGDRVLIHDNTVWVNGVALPRDPVAEACEVQIGSGDRVPCRRYRERNEEQSYKVQQIASQRPSSSEEVFVPPGHFFAMGDNRDDSGDSRFFGPVPYVRLRGRALLIHWSWESGEGLRASRLGRLVHQ